MAIQVQTVGATDLRLGATITKPNYAAARTIGGQSGQVMGHWRAMLVRIPSSGFTLNGSYVMLGHDGNNGGNFSSGDDSALRVFGTGSANALRPFARYRGGSQEAYAGTNGAEGQFASVPAMAATPAVFLVIEGVSNTGTTGSPVWRGWGAHCRVDSGTPASQVAATAISASWISNATGGLMRQIFAAAATGSGRTPAGVAIEQVALCQGDFPWDTANNRPHHDAIAALAGVGAGPFHTYETLVAAQNAGSLPYANCDQGLGNLDYHWTLSNLTTGLSNSGAVSGATLSQADWNSLTGGLIDTAGIAPAHWGPITLNALTLSAGTVVQGSSPTLNIIGATSGSTITVATGSLPAGLTLDSAARTITGTATTVGSSSFTLRETLAGATNSPRDSGLSLNVATTPTLGALTVSSPTGVVVSSPVVINIVGATAGSTLNVQAGTLPAGLTLNSAARTITGTPTNAGSNIFTLRETLAGAPNSPRESDVLITVGTTAAGPTITNPVVKFHGGRGARALAVIGTRDTGQTVERRWEYGTGNASDGAVVPGFDWAVAPVQSGGDWQTVDVLPVGGPYRLRVRYSGNAALAAGSDDWLVGAVALMHGQSGVERAFQQGTTPINYLSVPVSTGAQGLYVKLANQNGGGSGGYAQPVINATRVRSGETPALGHGVVLALNEWHAHNPGYPLCIVNMAINGTAMVDWAANAPAYNGSGSNSQASFLFLGTIGAQPGVSSGNSSGVVEVYAAALGRFVDVHMMMWTPGMSGDSTVRTNYLAGIDARFSNSPAAPFVVLPPWRGHRQPPDSSSTVNKRQEHLDFVTQLGVRGVLGPYWADIVQDGNPNPVTAGGTSGSLHCAFHSSATIGGAGSPVSDQNQVGMARLGRGFGRTAAWHFNRTVKAHGPRVIAAWFTDDSRNSIQIELGRRVRTLNGAATANHFWMSTDNGATFAQTGFSVSLSADSTRAVLTTTGAAFPATNLRVDYSRNWPLGPSANPDETLTERLLDGLLYDGEQYRGGTDLPAGQRTGNPLQGTNRIGAGVAGVPVQARGAAKLMATERWTGTRSVTVRMMAADGVTVLRQKTLVVTGS